LYFWDNGNANGLYNDPVNWNPDGNPGAADLAVHNFGAAGPVTINGNWDVDSFRISDGGGAIQTGGTVTIANGVGPDNGLWVGEFGPSPTSYDLNAGTININDPGDGFMIGRGGGSIGTFNLNSGIVNNLVGDTHIGLDGTATWNQSAGTFNGAGIQIGRFQSPTATVNLSGSAVWNVGLVLLSDGFLGSAVQSDLNINGPNVGFTGNGLVMKDIANLTFDGAGGGVSTMNLGGGIWLLDSAQLFLNNLPSASFLGETLTLIDNIGSQVGPDAEFANAPDGTVYGDWELDYTGAQVNLVSLVPEPTTFALMGLGSLALVTWRRRRKA
jgi:hypothetical protein